MAPFTSGAPASLAGSAGSPPLVVFGWLTWSHVGLSVGFLPKPVDALALIAIIAAAWLAESRAQGWAFIAAATAIASVVGAIFFDLFPRVMISSTNSAYNLTISNSASPSYTLTVLTVVAAIAFPIVLAYQTWSFWVFRKRLATPASTPSPPDGPPGEPVASEGRDLEPGKA